jgi:fumarate hydratase class II
MVCVRVIGNDATVAIAGASGNFELNVYKPVMIASLLESARLLADGIESFNDNCIAGLALDEARIDELLRRSLMLVTALAPHVGYDTAAKIAKTAHEKRQTLREAAVELGVLSGEKFDELVRAEDMVGPE